MGPCVHALMALQLTKWEGRSTLCDDHGGRAARGAGQTVELEAFHHLSDSDPAMISSHHLIPSNPIEDLEESERLEGRMPWDVGEGDLTHVRAISQLRPLIGVRVSQG